MSNNITDHSKNKVSNPDVIFDSRKKGVVSCPHCWTDQNANRDYCYCCGAKFIFLDEKDTH